jgi:fimbrial isopeptide formation D2 family protein
LKNNANVTITSTLPSATTTTSNGFSINYTNLLPGQMETILVNMNVAAIPTVNLGDVLTHNVAITSSETEANYTNNTFTSVQTVVGSYDPNDKTEARGSNVQIGQFTQNDYLFYTIRFQNSGTASAETVRIEDTLESEFDFASIRMVSASHNYTIQRINNKVVWTFDYINLPSEMADEPGSHGYITFKIKLNPGFAINDVIENTAKIYFDFNPAIVTNTFQTTFVPNLNMSTFDPNSLIVYPNPAKDLVQILLQNSTENLKEIVIYDMIGKTIKTIIGRNTQQVNIPVNDLSTGVYLIEITTGNNSKQFRKLMVN